MKLHASDLMDNEGDERLKDLVDTDNKKSNELQT